MATLSFDEETTKKVIRQVYLALYFNFYFSVIFDDSIFDCYFFIFQVEFYFSDSNLLTDGFMRKSITESQDGSILFLNFHIKYILFLFLSVCSGLVE